MQSSSRGGTITHGDSDNTLLTGDRQVHHVRGAAFPDLKLPLRPEALVFEGDKEAVSAGSIEIVDLLGSGEPVPRGLDEGDTSPAQAVDGKLQFH
jgi:hypothetical protein